MKPILWSSDDSVFVPALDAEHEKLFEDAEQIRQALTRHERSDQVPFRLLRFSQSFCSHLASEERLMRNSRFPGVNWHERQHQAGRAKLATLMEAVHRGGAPDVSEALTDMATWLKDHISVADKMFAAHLRNNIRTRLAS